MAANTQVAVATHILTVLALVPVTHEHKDARVCSEAIAHSINTNPVVVRRIVTALVKDGLVVSYPGKGGGLVLGRPAEEITLLDVHEAVGDTAVFTCKTHTPNPVCPTGTKMVEVLEPLFLDIEHGVRARLTQITQADVIQQMT